MGVQCKDDSGITYNGGVSCDQCAKVEGKSECDPYKVTAAELTKAVKGGLILTGDGGAPIANPYTSNCHYVQPDGKTYAKVQGEAVYNMYLGSKAQSCAGTAEQPRNWPGFCAAYVACKGQEPKVMACPTWNDHASGGCVSADECVNKASRSGSRIKTQSATLSGPQSISGYTSIGSPQIVTDSSLGANQQPVCVLAVRQGDKYFLGTGPAEADGKTCTMASMAKDSCDKSMRQADEDEKDLLHMKYTSNSTGGSTTSPNGNTNSGGGN